MKKENMTNAMRLLKQAGVAFTPIYYELPKDVVFSGEEVSAILGLPNEICFKSLCARGERMGIAIFVIPVHKELNLKRAAAALADKAVALTPVKDLVALTGYVRGSVSPVGLKKKYPVFIDASAAQLPEIEISGGAKGASIMVEPNALAEYLGARFHALTD